MIDFSQAVNAMVSRNKDIIGDQNGRDVGIQIGGGLWKKGDYSLLEYRLGVFNGSGINFADTANDAKDIGARLLINPIKGLSLGSSYYNGWGKAVKPTAEFIGQSEARIRFGLEASYTSDRLSLKGEFIRGRDGNTNRAGGYVLAGYYFIPKKLQAVIKYDTYDADMAKSENITTNYVVGANYHFSAWSRLQAFYTFREEEGPSINNNYFSIQFQIGF